MANHITQGMILQHETHGACERPFERSMEFNDRLIDILGNLNSAYVGGTNFRTMFERLLEHYLALTESEYGFIGEVLKKDGQPYLRTHAITNIAWNEASMAHFERMQADGMEFHNLKTLFGRVLTQATVVISNAPHSDSRAGGLPPHHPELRSFLGIPLFIGGNLAGMLGLANRPGGYDVTLANQLKPLNCLTGALIEAARSKQLRAMQVQLIHTEKMAAIGILTAGLAHEINNPANFAHAGAQVLVTKLEQFRTFLLALAGEDADEAIIATFNDQIDQFICQVRTIIEGTMRIRDLVRDLRTFSRLDEADTKIVAIAESVISTVQLVRTQFIHDVDIRCDLAQNPPFECRPAQLNQVFMNLIINACQAIQAKQRRLGSTAPGTLHIRSRIAGSDLLLEFEDNGCGMPEQLIGRIFEPFYTTKGVGEGSGLGLAISFGIVQSHRGEISVRSVDGEGTCFTVRLPLIAQE